MNRMLAVLALALLPAVAMAAPTHRHAKAGVAQVTDDGSLFTRSSGVLVLDPTTGETLYAKNADQQAPIASITKLMTAMVVLDAKLPLDEAIEISNEDVDHVKNTT